MNFLIPLGMCTYLFPEMKFSIATDKPVAIWHRTNSYSSQRAQTYTTFLTGSVDYLALNCDLTAMNLDRISAGKRQEILSQRTLSSLTDTNNGPFNTNILNRLKLLHI